MSFVSVPVSSQSLGVFTSLHEKVKIQVNCFSCGKFKDEGRVGKPSQ